MTIPTSAPISGVNNILTDPFFEVAENESLDIRNDGYSSGDVYVFDANTVYSGSLIAGESLGRCVVLEDLNNDNNQYCTMEFKFSCGSLIVHGVFYDLFAVRGTGCYEGVRGRITLVDHPEFYGYQFELGSNNAFCTNSAPFRSSPWTEASSQSQMSVDWNGDFRLSPGDVFVFDSNSFTTNAGAQGFLEGECMMLYDFETEETDITRPFCTITFYTTAGDRMWVQGLFDEMVIMTGIGCFTGWTGSIAGSRQGNGSYRYALNLDSANDARCSTSIFDEPWTEPPGDFYVNYLYEPWTPTFFAPNPPADYDLYTPGDVYVFSNKQVTAPSTSQVGLASGRCVVLEVSPYTFCSIAFKFPGGSITVQGIYTSMAVVGATGCYRGLQGAVVGDELDDESFTYTWNVSFSN